MVNVRIDRSAIWLIESDDIEVLTNKAERLGVTIEVTKTYELPELETPHGT